MMNRELLETVADDLKHLQKTWDGDVNENVIRRESVILRRLLVENDLAHAWREAGQVSQIKIVAPRVETILESSPAGSYIMIMGGGMELDGMFMALTSMQRGNASCSIPPGENPAEHAFQLSEYIESCSLYLKGERYSRREIVKFVANLLGGAHYRGTKQRERDPKSAWLEANLKTLPTVHASTGRVLSGRKMILMEVLAIGQAIWRSPDTQLLSKFPDGFI